MTGLIVSTIVFFVVSWYARKACQEADIPVGMTRGVAIFAVALIASYASGALVDWIAQHV
jgi:Mg/Co/Ni transporter MgtE